MKFFRFLRLSRLYIICNSLLIFSGFILSTAFSQNPQNQIRIANNLEKNQQYEQALVLYKKVYQSNKNNFSAIIGIKNCLIGLQKYEQLTAFLEKSVNNRPKNSPLFVELAEAYFMNNQMEKAMVTWQTHINNNIKNVTAYRLVAMSMVKQRLLDQAIDVYQLAINRIPNQQGLHVEISNLYLAQLNYEKASEHLLQYYQARPNQLEYLRRQLLSISDKSRDITPIVNAIHRFLATYPDQNRIRELLAGLYVKNKNFDKGFEIYKNISALENNPSYMQNFAMEAMSNDAYQHAIDGFKYILAAYPRSPIIPQVYFDLGRSYVLKAYANSDDPNSSQLMDQATKIFTDIIAEKNNSPFNIQSFIQLGDIYFDFYFDLDNAINYYQQFLKKYTSKNKTRDAILIKLGNVYLTKNQIDQARKTYLLTTQKESKTQSRFKEAEIYFYSGNFSQATKSLKDLLQTTNTSDPLMNDILSRWRLLKLASSEADSLALTRYAHAELLKFQKKYTEAVKIFSELSTENNALCSLSGREAGKLYLRLDKYDESIAVLTALQIRLPEDKDIDETIFLLAESEEKRNNLKTALKFYQEILTYYPNSMFTQTAREKARLLNKKINEDQI